MSDTSEDDVREMRKSSASDRLPSGSHTFSIDDFVFPIEELKMGEVIAAGSFGSVCHGTYKGLDVAVKRQRIEGKSVTDEKYLLSELAILRSLDHPRLLRYIGCALIHDPVVPGGDALDEDGQPRPNVVVTVTNVMPRGDLHMFLQAEKAACAKTTARGTDVKRASYESWRVKARMLHSACEGIAHLHERQLIHRDIKGHNLLLAEDDTLVVCDFGFCRKIASEAKRARRNHRHTLLGTPDYMAPELTLGEKYDEKADVYSFGMILLEIATNCVAGETGTCLERKPRDCFDLNFDAIRKKANAKLGRSGTLALPPPQSLVELAIQCCAYDPEERPSAEDAMEWLEELIEELASAVRVPTFSFPSLLLLSFFPSFLLDNSENVLLSLPPSSPRFPSSSSLLLTHRHRRHHPYRVSKSFWTPTRTTHRRVRIHRHQAGKRVNGSQRLWTWMNSRRTKRRRRAMMMRATHQWKRLRKRKRKRKQPQQQQQQQQQQKQ